MWEVFYTPHTDDETLGMAGSIVRAREIGHQVMVVLVTDNEPSVRGRRIFDGTDTFTARRVEWTKAMARLGVDEVVSWELRESAMAVDPAAMQEDILVRISNLALKLNIVHHHTVWGKNDIHVEVSNPTLAHVLCANALTIYNQVHPMVRCSLHAVYLYSQDPRKRSAPIVRHLTPEQMRSKLAAMECYKKSDDTIGYGYASVPELFNNAAIDPREFIQELPL